MKKRIRKKIDKRKSREKILLTFLFGSILTIATTTSAAMLDKNTNLKLQSSYVNDVYFYNPNLISEIYKKIENIFDNTEDITIDYSQYAPSPYQIQGNFETGWNVNNFWNGNDNGGVAIGPFQIHSRYMLEPFFNYLKQNAPYYFDLLNSQGGIKAIKQNNPQMKKFFCELCDKDKEFIELQAKFIDRDNFQPRIRYLKNQYGLDISIRGPAIEGLLRTISANIGWRTNYVIEEMVKNLSIYFNISHKNVIQSNLLNTISDSDFVNILHTSLNTVINKKIEYRFRTHLLNAYNATIKNDVIPNLGKEILTETEKIALEQKNRKLRAENIISTIETEFNSNKFSISEKEKINLINLISNDTSNNFINSKKLLSSYIDETIKNNNNKLFLQRKVSQNKNVKIDEQNIIFARQDLFIKNDDEDINLPKQKEPILPPNDNDIITVESVIAKNKEVAQKPSLLRKAELIRMNEMLANAVNILEDKNENITEIKNTPVVKKSTNAVLTKKALYAQKRADELTVENIIAKSEKRKDGGKIKPQNDMSALLAEAAMHLI